MPVQMRPAQVDFSQLAQMGQNVGGAIGQHNFGTALAGVPKSPDGGTDFNAMMDVIMQRRPDLGAKMLMAQSGPGGASVYGTPIYGEDAQGNSVLGVITKDGQFQQLDTGGVTPTPGVQFRDFGAYQQGFTKGGRAATPALPNTGAVPQGFQPSQSGGLMPMPGSPQEQEIVADQRAAGEKQAAKQRQADVVTEDIGRVRDSIKNATVPVTGFIGGITQNVPGTAAHDTQNLLNTIKANIGFDKLQAMRDASPTGGALGQVSEMENKLLQSTFGALEQSQSEEQLLKNLDRLETLYKAIVHGGPISQRARQSQATQGRPAAPVTVSPPANINTQELDLISQAREAIAAGADPQAVMQRLQEMGVRQ